MINGKNFLNGIKYLNVISNITREIVPNNTFKIHENFTTHSIPHQNLFYTKFHSLKN